MLNFKGWEVPNRYPLSGSFWFAGGGQDVAQAGHFSRLAYRGYQRR